jgi:hypothetical protein
MLPGTLPYYPTLPGQCCHVVPFCSLNLISVMCGMSGKFHEWINSSHKQLLVLSVHDVMVVGVLAK